MSFHLIIPAAGTGTRFGSTIPKQFFNIGGREIISITISKFHRFQKLKSIIIAAKTCHRKRLEKIIKKYNFYKINMIVAGGRTRQDSVYNALKSLTVCRKDFIAIHDAVRPFIKVNHIRKLFSEAVKYKALIPCIKINDTIKQIGKKHYIDKTVERNSLSLAQTPQIFRFDILINSYDYAMSRNLYYTDDSAVVEAYGYKVKRVDGDVSNIKITSRFDIKRIKY